MTISVAAEPLMAALLASLRIVAWLLLVPPFSGRSVPARAKVVLALGLSLAVAPSVPAGGLPTGAVALFTVALTQVAVGLALGFVSLLVLGVIQAAGSLIDIFGGFAIVQAFDPSSNQMNTVFGRFHQVLATTLLFVTGGHLVVMGGLLKTFDVLPLGETPSTRGTPSMVIEAFSTFFVTAVQIALPMIAVLFVTDLGLALLTKVNQQMNVMNVMFPAKIGLTLLLVGLSFPMLPDALSRLVEMVNEAAAALVDGGER